MPIHFGATLRGVSVMALVVKRHTIEFPSHSGSANIVTENVNMPELINTSSNRVDVVINGFEARFTNSDRELYHIKVDVRKGSVTSDSVEVRGSLLLRDSSGNIDDPFQGWIEVVVIAETA
jgi:hypothetical protein